MVIQRWRLAWGRAVELPRPLANSRAISVLMAIGIVAAAMVRCQGGHRDRWPPARRSRPGVADLGALPEGRRGGRAGGQELREARLRRVPPAARQGRQGASRAAAAACPVRQAGVPGQSRGIDPARAGAGGRRGRPSIRRSTSSSATCPDRRPADRRRPCISRKAMALAASQRWTAEQRKRFERLCDQGDAFVAEARGDWKAAPDGAGRLAGAGAGQCRARHRLGRALFGVGAVRAGPRGAGQGRRGRRRRSSRRRSPWDGSTPATAT